MSEEKTENIGQMYDTRPTLETVLERLEEFRAAVEKRFDEFQGRVEKRFDALDIRLDRMDSFAHKTYSELTALRADFNELKGQLKEHFPAAK